MAEFTIQFEAEPDADVEALAQSLRDQLNTVPGVSEVQAEVMESRDLTLVASSIMACLTMAPVVIGNVTKIVNALKDLVQASQGLKSAVVEIRGRRIPVSQLQPSDIEPAAAGGAAH